MATVLSLVHAVALGLLSPLPGLYPPSKVAPLPPSPRHYQRTRAPLLAASPPPPSSKITVRKPQEPLRRLKPAAAGEEEPPWLRVLARLKPPLVRLLARLKPLLRILARLKPLVPVLAALVFLMVQMARRTARAPRPVEVSYAAFMTLVTTQAASISDLRISLSRYNFMLNGQPAYTLPARLAPDVAFFLHRSGVDFRAAATSGLASLVPLLFPCIWLAAVYSLMRRQMNGATGNVGKKASNSLRLSADDLSFDDIAGVDTAKQEVQEVVSMLKDPSRYAAAGARLPSGVLMVGPPGTGKTLLARVMAAQAGVPFFYCSGSDFVELFVGRGAARVRALFKEAAAAAPCLIFVDELDALGKQRSLRMSGSNDEAEQTLNQMLACMDGLETSNNGVVVMGATNRYEILDPALTRPGRFDRLVRISLPDETGRLAILRVHTRKLKLAVDVDLALLAAATPSYSGAELAALGNEAAIRSVRRSAAEVVQADFVGAINSFNAARRRAPGSVVLDGLLPVKPAWWPGWAGEPPPAPGPAGRSNS